MKTYITIFTFHLHGQMWTDRLIESEEAFRTYQSSVFFRITIYMTRDSSELIRLEQGLDCTLTCHLHPLRVLYLLASDIILSCLVEQRHGQAKL